MLIYYSFRVIQIEKALMPTSRIFEIDTTTLCYHLPLKIGTVMPVST